MSKDVRSKHTGWAHNDKYMELAKEILNSFYIDTKDGGFTYKSDKDGWWYEEYASRMSDTQSYFLNGFLSTLIHLNQYHEYTKYPSGKFLFDKGVEALRNDSHMYDVNKSEYQGYSLYDRLGKLQGESYHKYQVALLSTLLKVTYDAELKKYHDKWESYNGPFPKKVPLEIENETRPNSFSLFFGTQ
jgi:hypothetical protein